MKKQDLVKLIREVISEAEMQELNVIVKDARAGNNAKQLPNKISATEIEKLDRVGPNAVVKGKFLNGLNLGGGFVIEDGKEIVDIDTPGAFIDNNQYSVSVDSKSIRIMPFNMRAEGSRDKMTMEELRESIRTEIKRQLNLTK